MISYEYIPHDICPSMMKIFIDESSDTVMSIAVLGGCHGYLQAILRLLKGKVVWECIEALEGIKCGNRQTSCPDQIARALKMYAKRRENGNAR